VKFFFQCEGYKEVIVFLGKKCAKVLTCGGIFFMKSPYLDKTFVVVALTKQELYTFSSIFLSDLWPNLAHSSGGSSIQATANWHPLWYLHHFE
jgi:hypothetical protein